jgi:hypothetical protein
MIKSFELSTPITALQVDSGKAGNATAIVKNTSDIGNLTA